MGEGGGDAQLDVKCELQTRCVVTLGYACGLVGHGVPYRTFTNDAQWLQNINFGHPTSLEC